MNRSARSMLRRISRNAVCSPLKGLKGIDSIPGNWRAQIGLQALAIDHINASVKQSGNVILQSDVIEKRNVSLEIDIDHDIEVAVRPILAPGHGAEHGGMGYAPRAQYALVATESGNGILCIHAWNM
jgi:hypothetical protein